MGGVGSGGMRPGSGPKTKDAKQASLRGSRQRGQAKSVLGAAFPLLPAPSGMPDDHAAVWNELAPLACEARTLNAGTAPAFADLCEAIVLKRLMAAQIARDGFTYLKVTVDGSGQEHSELKAHPLVSQHRGMMQRVEVGLLRFKLSPNGKELVVPVTDENPFDEFDEGSVQ